MRVEYAIELYDTTGAKRAWYDAYATIETARRAAVDLVKNGSPDGWSAGIFKRTSPFGQIGATWEEAENIGPYT